MSLTVTPSINQIYHDDTQHDGECIYISATMVSVIIICIVMLIVVIESVVSVCWLWYAECCYTERRYVNTIMLIVIMLAAICSVWLT